jgi:hypothetical protein
MMEPNPVTTSTVMGNSWAVGIESLRLTEKAMGRTNHEQESVANEIITRE